MADKSNLNYLIIDGVTVDLLGLISIDYLCDPKLCNGQKSCCAYYDVCITEEDVNKIIPHFPEAACFAKHIKTMEGEYVNVFDEPDDDDDDDDDDENNGFISLDTDDDFTCKLAWKNEAGDVLCSLHSQALKNNISFYDAKPKSCCLWPLAESDSKAKSLSIDSDCVKFPCVTIKKVQDYKLNKEIALIIKNIYGLDFLNKINNAIEKLN